MEIVWQVWSYIYLVMAIAVVCFAFAWRDRRGKALFCVFAILAVAIGVMQIAFWLLLPYDGLFISAFRIISVMLYVAESVFLLIFTIVVMADSRSHAKSAGSADQQQGRESPATIMPAEIVPIRANVKGAGFGLLLMLFILTNVFVFLGIGLIASASRYYGDNGPAVAGVFVLILGAGLGIWLSVLCAVYIYRMWRLLPEYFAQTTPGKAVGFLFIPLFNLYWIFVAFYGWSQSYNKFLAETGRKHYRRMPEGLFLTMCILSVLGAIPFVNYVVAIPDIIITIIVWYFICRGINAIANESALKSEPAGTDDDEDQQQ